MRGTEEFPRYGIKSSSFFGLTEHHKGGEGTIYNTYKEHWNRLYQVMALNTKRVLFAEKKRSQESMT